MKINSFLHFLQRFPSNPLAVSSFKKRISNDCKHDCATVSVFDVKLLDQQVSTAKKVKHTNLCYIVLHDKYVRNDDGSCAFHFLYTDQ